MFESCCFAFEIMRERWVEWKQCYFIKLGAERTDEGSIHARLWFTWSGFNGRQLKFKHEVGKRKIVFSFKTFVVCRHNSKLHIAF